MRRRPRRNQSGSFNAKVTLAAVEGDRMLAAMAEHLVAHPNQITQWKAQLLEGTACATIFAAMVNHCGQNPDAIDR